MAIRRSKVKRRARQLPPARRTVPPHIIEYFLLGQTWRGEIERYMQDGGIVLDVWLAFAEDLHKPQRVLLAPDTDVSAVHLGAALHHALIAYRKTLKGKGKLGTFPAVRETPNVSPLESYVAATVYLDELLEVVLPITSWWREKNLAALHRKAAFPVQLTRMLAKAIEIRLRKEDPAGLSRMRGELSERGFAAEETEARPQYPHWRVIDAAPIAALMGVFVLAVADPDFVFDVPAPISRGTAAERDGAATEFEAWVRTKSKRIADAAVTVLARPLTPAILAHARKLAPPSRRGTEGEGTPPSLIQRVFLNREAELAATDGISAIKADAAVRLFKISCSTITWGIIDAGIATGHPAFIDRSVVTRNGPPLSRVRKTLDFTLIQRIRNFDLIDSLPGSAQRKRRLAEVAAELDGLPGRKASKEFRTLAVNNLDLIAKQLDLDMQPDWALIEPLISIDGHDDGMSLSSDHGTHVAGVLAADWRVTRGSPRMRLNARSAGTPSSEPAEVVILQGVCPEINLYDLRVVAAKAETTEFALVAAIEYVQHINQRAGRNGPIVHGVNISLSIPHKVRSYGCGATPVCVACDRLAASGVVVVAAAGNRGWNEQEIGFGNFVFCSITDPGNAESVITVGATHGDKPHTYGVSFFSSRGPTGDGRAKPDIVAPGERVRGPIRGNADAEFDGTSQAAPFVSGAAAMLLARNRELIGNSARVKEILLRSATDLSREKYFQGHGLLDVLRALQSL